VFCSVVVSPDREKERDRAARVEMQMEIQVIFLLQESYNSAESKKSYLELYGMASSNIACNA
jgi:hypothetical protein